MRKSYTLILMVVVLMVLSACSLPGETPVVPAGSAEAPEVTQVLLADTPANQTPTSTLAAAPTSAQTVMPNATSTTASISDVGGCTNKASLVADVTVPDGTQLTPGKPFTKTWRLKNTGTCTWDNRYALVFAGGNHLGSLVDNFPMDVLVGPGELVDLSIEMVAPTDPNTYQGDWKLQAAQGQIFGVGLNDGPFWVNIVVLGQPNYGSIAGFLWDDYCLTNEDGDALNGDCVVDGNGDYHADGMIQPNEGYISNVTIQLIAGRCGTENKVQVTAVTDRTGKYTFGNLQPGTYCVSMNAASPENGPKLLPGDWTFPSQGIWYQEITLLGNDNAYPVNFGWDYQLK